MSLTVFDDQAATRQRLRRRLVLLIDRLIVMLDDLDGDPDAEPEEDNDTSDLEASLCGVTFGIGSPGGLDQEANTAPFKLDQTPGRA